MLIMRKYVKFSVKKRESPSYYFSSRGRKIKNITKIEHTRVFYGVSRTKTNLHNKFMI